MTNSTNRKLLFNNLDEYQDEVERLQEIIKNQSILIEKLKTEEPKLRESKIMPIILGANSIPKTFPRFNSPEYLHYIKNNPVLHYIDNDNNDFEKQISDFVSSKSIGKNLGNLNVNLESISGNIEKSTEKPIKELLLMQSKGQKLTKEEKGLCLKYEKEIRLKRKKIN